MRLKPLWAPAPMPCVVCGTPTEARLRVTVLIIGPWWQRALCVFLDWWLWPSRPVCRKAECARTLMLKLVRLQGLTLERRPSDG